MNTFHIAYSGNLENQIISAFSKRKTNVVSLNKEKMILPVVVTTYGKSMGKLKKILGYSSYNEIFELDSSKNITEYKLKLARDKISRIAKYCFNGDLDLLVVSMTGSCIHFDKLLNQYFKDQNGFKIT